MSDEEFVRKGLAVSVAQICSNIGWHAMSNSTMQMMTDILYEYFRDLARSVKKFSEISDSLTPDINDVKMALDDKDVALPDLLKYLKQVGPIEFPHQVPKFPVPTTSNLNIMKPGNREIVTRPVYVHEHLPTMFPEQPDDATSQNESCSNQAANSSSSLTIFNNTLSFQGTQASKNDRTNKEKMITHRRLREISSVVMTSSGFLSPSREGKLPESRLMPTSNLKTSCNPRVEQLPIPKLPKEVKDVTLHKQPLQKIPNFVREKEKNTVEISNNNSNANVSIKNNEVAKIKKLTNLKITPKVKSLKKGSISELHQVTERKKPPKIKNKAKLSLLNTIFDKPAQVKHTKKTSDEKLTAVPNKQKLNIFKKISKIKDEKNIESHGNSNSKSNVSIISKQNSTVSSNVFVKPDTNPEVIEDKPFKPVFFSPVVKNPDCKSPKKEQEFNSEVNPKRKKKQKKPTDGLKLPSLTDATINNDIGTKKSKTKHDPDKYSQFSFFGPLSSGFLQPGTNLLPPSLASNPLVPKFTAPNRVLPILDKVNPINPMMYLPLPEENCVDKSKLLVDHFSPPFIIEKEKVPAEKTKPKKGHKKIKKDKIKSKKKKDKKDKSKDKSKSERKKEKLLKKKKCLDTVITEEIITCKQEPLFSEDTKEPTINAINEDAFIPKIKLKLSGSTESVSVQPKIVIKPVTKNKSLECEGDLKLFPKETSPVEQIKSSISKSKMQSKEISSIPIIPPSMNPIKKEDAVVVFNSKPSSSKTSIVDVNTPSTTTGNTLPIATDSTHVTTGSKQKTKTPKKVKKTPSSQPHPAFYFDESGNQVWICPTCTKRDDGSPMIGCDGCDAWYHWVCVGIQCPPDCAVWYCPKCLTKRAEQGTSAAVSIEKAKRGRPLKKKNEYCKKLT